MLKGTFGLAKNTEQQSEAKEVLRSDVVKCCGGTPWLPAHCPLPCILNPSQLLLNLTAEPGKQLG